MCIRKKKYFFKNFFLLLHIFTSRRNFFGITKITYLQPFRKIMGGPEKALHRTNDERTTSDERTTWTIIIPRQDSQNPRANNTFISPRILRILTGSYDRLWCSFVVVCLLFVTLLCPPMISLNGSRYENLIKTKKFRLDL